MMADDSKNNYAIIESFHLESEYDEVLQEAFDKGAIINAIKKLSTNLFSDTFSAAFSIFFLIEAENLCR